MPISEFWARGEDLFPVAGQAATRLRPRSWPPPRTPTASRSSAPESFTSDRGWRDHPFLLKAMGDRKFCEGLNRMIFHLSAHQAYDNMIPGPDAPEVGRASSTAQHLVGLQPAVDGLPGAVPVSAAAGRVRGGCLLLVRRGCAAERQRHEAGHARGLRLRLLFVGDGAPDEREGWPDRPAVRDELPLPAVCPTPTA